MAPKQKNWVFLACMLIIAIFSVVVVFRNVKHMGQYTGQSVSTTNIQEVMAEVEIVNKAIERALTLDGGNRAEVYARASKVASLLEELVKEAPDDANSNRIGDWDEKTTKAVAAANLLADVAGDPASDWSKAPAAFRSLRKSCVDCHDQFRKE